MPHAMTQIQPAQRPGRTRQAGGIGRYNSGFTMDTLREWRGPHKASPSRAGIKIKDRIGDRKVTFRGFLWPEIGGGASPENYAMRRPPSCQSDYNRGPNLYFTVLGVGTRMRKRKA